MSCDDVLEISPDGKLLVGDSESMEIDCFRFCAKFWQANCQVDTGMQIRPSVPNGYALECTVAGTTGGREPRWLTTLDATVPDGSAIWKVVAAESNGINPLSAPTAEVSPNSGLTVDSLEVLQDWKIKATYSAETAGEYQVMFQFVVDGQTRGARQSVTVV